MAVMAKTRKKASAPVGRQAPGDVWSPEALLQALLSGSDDDKRAAMRRAGIVDTQGKLTKKSSNWGKKVTRTPNVEELDDALPGR
jgi:hypothetical protein